uniref:hypothetical protein n=1 Tax=Alistipes sp. TaxID=1872444 RepID=UPI00405674C0
MITDELVSFETAKLAKEKGFDVPTDRYYHIYDDIVDAENSLEMTGNGCADFYNSLNTYRCAAPTQSLLQRWLRQEKGIIVEVLSQATCSNDAKICYWWALRAKSNGITFDIEEDDSKTFENYEQALEDAITRALKEL